MGWTQGCFLGSFHLPPTSRSFWLEVRDQDRAWKLMWEAFLSQTCMWPPSFYPKFLVMWIHPWAGKAEIGSWAECAEENGTEMWGAHSSLPFTFCCLFLSISNFWRIGYLLGIYPSKEQAVQFVLWFYFTHIFEVLTFTINTYHDLWFTWSFVFLFISLKSVSLHQVQSVSRGTIHMPLGVKARKCSGMNVRENELLRLLRTGSALLCSSCQWFSRRNMA